VKYSFRHTHNFNSIKPDVAGVELDRIAERDGGLTAVAVVNEARPEEAPLHPAFEWRDDVAAEEWRRMQARSLIAAVQVVSEPAEPPRLAFVSVMTDDGVRTYQAAAVVASDADMLARALADARHYLLQAEKRLEEVQRLGGSPKAKRARERVRMAREDIAAE
jgi:hypothetical protein